MGRHLILRRVDRRLIERIRERAAPLGIDSGELARALLIAQLAEPPARAPRPQRRLRKLSKA